MNAPVTLKGREGQTKEVEAEVFGNLAVHKCWSSVSEFTITHVPTGFRLPVRSEAEKAVKACADELSKTFDWDFSQPDGARGMKAKVVPILDEWGVYEYSGFN